MNTDIAVLQPAPSPSPIGGILLDEVVLMGAAEETSLVPALQGIQVQAQNLAEAFIIDGDPVLFDTVLINQTPDISYDAETGVFTITEPGNYFVSWWVTTGGSAGPVNMIFGVTLNGITLA
jgi:hypothetical protein